MEHHEHHIKDIEDIKTYFYSQHRRIHMDKDAGPLAGRKAALAEHLNKVGNTAWCATFGLRIEVFTPQPGQALVKKYGQRQMTRHLSADGQAEISLGGRPMAWAVAVGGLAPKTYFADAQTGQIGFCHIQANSEIYDFIKDENLVLSDCEDDLSHIFYPGSLPEAFPVDPLRDFDMVPVDIV